MTIPFPFLLAILLTALMPFFDYKLDTFFLYSIIRFFPALK